MIGDDGTYYNTSELNIAIRVDDLQRVISEKSIGEDKAFQSEYKVLWEKSLQRTIKMSKHVLQIRVSVFLRSALNEQITMDASHLIIKV